MSCFLKDDSNGTLYIARKRDVESGAIFTDGQDIFLLLEDDDEYHEKQWKKAKLSFNEMVVLACFLSLVFFWLPVGFLLLRFLGFSVF